MCVELLPFGWLLPVDETPCDLDFEGNEIEWQMAIGIIFRQILRGQVREDAWAALGHYSSAVETEHAQQDPE